MAINETQKLSRLARHSQEEFLSQGSLLNQTKLNRFIFIALLLHTSVIILQSFIIVKPKDSLALRPIKVKYVDIQKPAPIKKERLTKVSKPIKAEKQKTKPSEQKKYRQTKAVAPQTRGKPNITQHRQPQVIFKKVPALPKQRSTKKYAPLPHSDKEIVAPEVVEQNTILVPAKRLGALETLSMLNNFDPGKYAMQDTRTSIAEDSGYDEPISLDTTETKYVSYFNRIKHQIQRVWRYPAQAAQRGVSGQLMLKFQISRDGNLLGVRLVDNSGFDILDIAAVKAVKEAAPYYPFPITIPKKKLSILATFVYNPNSNQITAQ